MFLIFLTWKYFCQLWTGGFLFIFMSVRGCRCASWFDLFALPKYVHLPYLRHLFFSYDKDIWIAANDCFLHFYIIVLFPLTAILQLINFTASYFLVC